jgi:catechol 2,3-dioxygenase-like lactoylglutathione lyase family enzyme
MAVKVSRLFHIEIVVPDAEASYQFLNRVFGAQKVEEDMASYLDDLSPHARVIHVGLGGVVLQLVQPTSEFESWNTHLREKGSGVHNLTFLVDDPDSAVKTLETEGAPTIWSIELERDRIFGPAAGSGPLPVHLVDSANKVGFKIELAESPGKHILEKMPAVAESNDAPNKIFSLFHIESVVNDAEESYQFFNRVFGAQKVEENISTYLEDVFTGTKIIHVGIGGVVLQFVQPTKALASWCSQLKDKGPSVHNLTYLVENLDNTVKALEKEGAPSIWTFELDKKRIFGPESGPDSLRAHLVDAVDKVGFRFEIAELPKPFARQNI